MANKLSSRQRAEIERQRSAYQARLNQAPRTPTDDPIRLGTATPTRGKVVKAKPLGQGLRQAVRRATKKQVKTPDRRVAAGKIILRPIHLDGGKTKEASHGEHEREE